MLLWKKNDKNGTIWCNFGVPKYVTTNLKINSFKDNKSTKKLNYHICFAQINLDVDVSTNRTSLRGVW